jgi:predicted anti-sigma-YlaC factor YlaD
MRCHDCRIAISARLDGEDPGRPAAAIEIHLQGCEACRRFAEDAEALHRSVRLAPAAPMPDLTPTILHAVGREVGRDRHERERTLGLRVCLALIGLLQIAVALPALILGDDAGLPVHTARHIGSFTAALAVGFLFVAWRPERAAGLLPVASALVAFVIGTTVVDVVTGHTAAFSESSHVTEVVGLVVTWLLARPDPLRRPSGVETASA